MAVPPIWQAVVAQSLSVVVLFEGAAPEPAPQLIQKAVGGEIVSTTRPDVGGITYELDAQLVVFVRPQGPLFRVEVQRQGPHPVDHTALRSFALNLLDVAKGSRTSSVGVNHVTLFVGGPVDHLDLLANTKATTDLLGVKKAPTVSEIRLSREIRPAGTMSVTLDNIRLRAEPVGPHEINAVRANFNYSLPAPTRTEVRSVLSVKNLGRIDGQIKSVARSLREGTWR